MRGMVQLPALPCLQVVRVPIIQFHSVSFKVPGCFSDFCNAFVQLTALTCLSLSACMHLSERGRTPWEEQYSKTVDRLGEALKALTLLESLDLNETVTSCPIGPVMKQVAHLTRLTYLV